MKEVDKLVTKMDLLLKRLDERATDKEAMNSTIKAMDLQMTCKVCGEVGHSGNDYPETHEEAAYLNNGFHQQNNKGWNIHSHLQGGNNNLKSNQHSLKELVLGQAKINENIIKKITYNDKMLENIN